MLRGSRAHRILILLLLSIAGLSTVGRWSSAATVWSGLTKSFSKADATDPTLPQNQDPLSGSVVLTRGSAGGMINIAAESFYTSGSSPALTAWATDLNNPGKTIAAANYQNLTVFTDWIDAYDGAFSSGANIVGRNAVVHLIPEDIYLDLKFTSWTATRGGGFTYMRAEPTAPILAGDYNNNGTVDAADYVLWRKSNNTATTLANDSTPGTDATDYAVWRAHFGQPPGSGSVVNANAAVPEPKTLVLLFVASVGLLMATLRTSYAR